MKPDWDALGAEFKDHPKVVIADVDCTAAGKPLCDKFGVRGYPTIKCAAPARRRTPPHCRHACSALRHACADRACPNSAPPPRRPDRRRRARRARRYFNPPDEEGEDYKGGRDLASLKKFASTELGPGCSVDAMENCDDKQKAELEKYIAMPAEERATKLEELKKTMSEADDAHQALLKELQSTFKESQEKLEKLKEDSAPQIKLLKAATPAPAKDGGKDEV